MLKIVLATSVLFIGVQVPASAQVGNWRYAPAAKAARHPGVAANGRCGGVSYGTGARRCGTLSGGPSGGISGRN